MLLTKHITSEHCLCKVIVPDKAACKSHDLEDEKHLTESQVCHGRILHPEREGDVSPSPSVTPPCTWWRNHHFGVSGLNVMSPMEVFLITPLRNFGKTEQV